jgi:hypothetical protein
MALFIFNDLWPLTTQTPESWLPPNCSIDLKLGQQAKSFVCFGDYFYYLAPDREHRMGWRRHRNEDMYSSGRAAEGLGPFSGVVKEHFQSCKENSHSHCIDRHGSLLGPHLSEQKVLCSLDCQGSGAPLFTKMSERAHSVYILPCMWRCIFLYVILGLGTQFCVYSGS